jgi:hypothetical protein
VTDRLYRSRYHAWLAMCTKAAAAVIVCFVVNFLTQIFAPGAWWPVAAYIPLVAFWLWNHGQRRYFAGNWKAPEAGLRGWILLFFLGFLTHVLLDCFTTYGTQVFAPFSDQRIAMGNRFRGGSTLHVAFSHLCAHCGAICEERCTSYGLESRGAGLELLVFSIDRSESHPCPKNR